MTKCFKWSAAVALVVATSSLVAMPLGLKDKMQLTLQEVAEFYSAAYAPADWKKTHLGWDLGQQVETIQSQINSTAELNLHDFHRLLRGMVNSMRDFHVSIRFQWTEKASLPFLVRSAEGRYFFAYIDRSKLSVAAFPFFVGDEILTFGGRPVGDVVNEIRETLGGNTAITEAAMAEMQLTARSAARGDVVPQGGVDITGRNAFGGPIKQTQVIWEYTPEKLTPEINPRDLKSDQVLARRSDGKGDKPAWLQPRFEAGFAADEVQTPQAASPFDIGARKSFLPPLGTIIWESAESAIFHAYIYRTPNNRIVGYVRLPSYAIDDTDSAINEFASVMQKMQASTDALVVDQVNNPGGYIFYCYALISHLSNKTVATPLHRIKMTQADVIGAIQNLEQMEQVKTDEDAKRVMGPTLTGYPVSYTVARGFVEFSRALIADWNSGLSLSRPVYLGVDHIAPASSGVYAKPILFVINELDFSGGDFVPATLQDATRKGQANVTIFGTRTAGAGGYILDAKFLNQMGIARLSVTGSIAERDFDKNPIENLGVTADPGFEYQLKATDYASNFSSYAAAINQAVEKIIIRH